MCVLRCSAIGPPTHEEIGHILYYSSAYFLCFGGPGFMHILFCFFLSIHITHAVIARKAHVMPQYVLFVVLAFALFMTCSDDCALPDKILDLEIDA